MALHNICFMVLAILVVAGIIVPRNYILLAQLDCEGVEVLNEECTPFVQNSGLKDKPSDGCCEAVKKADITCVCAKMTKEMEMAKKISMEKAVYMLESCGKPLPHGTQCGGYTVP